MAEGGAYDTEGDYLGYQFWTSVKTVPTTLSDVLGIQHQNVTITVNELYGAQVSPVPGVPAYLFTDAASYLGASIQTNSRGQAVFNLPQKAYKVRADYLSAQYWPEVFTRLNWEARYKPFGEAEVHSPLNGGQRLPVPGPIL
jgi:hypothetical protein